ncbi:hypothetical protein [Micromonospora musae]|uniref:hypothetical protein n=1 Tax=Micromonospora musae TaxID=1894970 RepID=UPI00343D7B0B
MTFLIAPDGCLDTSRHVDSLLRVGAHLADAPACLNRQAALLADGSVASLGRDGTVLAVRVVADHVDAAPLRDTGAAADGMKTAAMR